MLSWHCMSGNADGERSAIVNGEEIRYNIYTSRRTRRPGIIVDADGGVRVRMPQGASQKTVDEFIAANARWLIRTREKMKKTKRRLVLADDRAQVPLFGREIVLCLVPELREPRLTGMNGRETLALPSSGQDGKVPLDFLRSFYMGETESYLLRKLPEFERLTKLHAPRYELKEFRSKWGSCSPSGTVRFNSKLSAFPEDVIDYVIVHELCHLRHRNHDASFWRLVSSFLPDCLERRQRLRRIALETTFAW